MISLRRMQSWKHKCVRQPYHVAIWPQASCVLTTVNPLPLIAPSVCEACDHPMLQTGPDNAINNDAFQDYSSVVLFIAGCTPTTPSRASLDEFIHCSCP